MQEVVSVLPLLSRTELGHTVCVHLGWQMHDGHNRIQSPMGLLDALEQLDILRWWHRLFGQLTGRFTVCSAPLLDCG